MTITPEFPIVVKIGHAHAGYGKMKIHDQHSFSDLKSVMALGYDYCTAEHYVHGLYDVRIQRIGDHVRAFKRVSVSSNWKTNTGSSVRFVVG